MPADRDNQILLICLKVLADGATTVPTHTPRHTSRRTQRLHSQLRIIGVNDASAHHAWHQIVQQGWATGDSTTPGTLCLTLQGHRRIESFTQQINNSPIGGWYDRALHHLYQ